MRTGRTSVLAWLSALVAVACSDPPRPTDTGTDVMDSGSTEDVAVDTPPPMDVQCTNTFTFESGSATGAANPWMAGAGQVRAGRITQAALPADRTGLGLVKANDFVIANNRVAVMIEDTGPSDLYNPWGGGIVGIARNENGTLVRAADFNEAIFGLGRHTLQTTSVTVLNDGTSGGRAIVRAQGTMKPIPFIDEFGRALAPGDYTDIEASIDYELAPDSDRLDIVATFAQRRTTDAIVPIVLHGFFQTYRMPRFAPGVGFDGDRTGNFPYVAFVDEAGASYAWFAEGSTLSSFISVSGFDAFRATRLTIPACAKTRVPLAHMIIGDKELDSIVERVAAEVNTPTRTVTGRVTEANGSAATNVRVHATSTDGMTYFTRTLTDANGNYTLHVPATSDVQLQTWRAGDQIVSASVPVAQATANMMLGARGTLHVEVRDMQSGAALPARVQVSPMTGNAPSLGAAFGERKQPGNNRIFIEFPANGVVDFPLPAGRYQVTASRGFEYTLSETTVDVTANATANSMVQLRRSVDSAGMVCGDFHIHTTRSPDSEDPATHKLLSAAGDGVEVPVRSDHEFVASWDSLIGSLNLQTWMYGVSSLELTTFAWGHFGVVPIEPTSAPNGGGFDWAGRLPPAVFADVRARAEQPTIIINHPRSGGAAGAYFTASGFDPNTGTATRTNMWDTQFTAVEVFNDSDFTSNQDGTVRDWFSLLNHGRRVFAVGSSDSHKIVPGSPVGYPRTCMALGIDDPVQLRTMGSTVVRNAVAQGRSTIYGGLLVTATGTGNRGPGETIAGVGANATIRVRVQAPDWITAERLQVFVDGNLTQTITLDASTRDPGNSTLRYNADVTVPVAQAGSWVVFVASSSQEMTKVFPGRRPFGVTNPIFLTR